MMAPNDKYEELLRQYPEFVSKEQMRVMCHISKRTARYLLISGLVPCVNNGKKTRNYQIAMTDIVDYLRQREIVPEQYQMPPNIERQRYKPSDPTDSEEFTRALQLYYEILFADYPDVISVAEVSEITGFSKGCVLRWLNAGKVKGFKKWSTYRIPKICLIEYMISRAYRKMSNKSEKQKSDMGGFLKWQAERLS